MSDKPDPAEQRDAAALVPVDAPVAAKPWTDLRRHTPARIGLGRAGVSTPTTPHLDFQVAHALARDAVHLPFEAALVADALSAFGIGTVRACSAAHDRIAFLQRPDLGKRLSDESRAELLTRRDETGEAAFDIVFVVADGLSPMAVHATAAALIAATLAQPQLGGWRPGPVVLVEQGRVAVGDEIGEVLGAAMVVVLIGERPGLSSTDSLGIYMTFGPRHGLNDSARNCISNVRPAGLSVEQAAYRLALLMIEAKRRGLSGVALKDQSAHLAIDLASPALIHRATSQRD